ncbi:unnamed protein product [Triticum turgidum subsp. durum]|uniref:Uncharacterized protein n=1 Tax=Triticum turgidum subsp. durum TaxID=4567 RepID=A0A9R1R9X0_TRITD|nr:unnamed protein product [Triticum turgidum subsp. durum]
MKALTGDSNASAPLLLATKISIPASSTGGAAEAALLGKGRYKVWALAAIALLALWSMSAASVSLRWSAGDLAAAVSGDLDAPLRDDLDSLVRFFFAFVRFAVRTPSVFLPAKCLMYGLFVRASSNVCFTTRTAREESLLVSGSGGPLDKASGLLRYPHFFGKQIRLYFNV